MRQSSQEAWVSGLFAALIGDGTIIVTFAPTNVVRHPSVRYFVLIVLVFVSVHVYAALERVGRCGHGSLDHQEQIGHLGPLTLSRILLTCMTSTTRPRWKTSTLRSYEDRVPAIRGHHQV